jgi:hypothetical protein
MDYLLDPKPDGKVKSSGSSPKASPGKKSASPAPAPKTAFRKSKGGSIPPALAALKALFKKNYYFSDDDVIDLVLGIVAGNHIDSDPIWLHLISAPSAGKTELLYSVFDCDETFFLSDFTAASLISGYKDPDRRARATKATKAKDGPTPEEVEALNGEGGLSDSALVDAESSPEPAEAEPAEDEDEDYSLLPKLDGKVVVTKDFSVIHNKPSETRSQILSILRDVYDGYASRGVGNGAPKGFHSRFNYLTGMTPDIEKSWSLNTLGERFLMYRIHIDDRRAHALQALRNALDEDRGALLIRQELQSAVKAFMETVPRTKPKVSNEMVHRILDLAELLSTCRTYVYRDRNDDLPCLPQAELSARVGKQLLRVGQSVASVRGKPAVTDAEFTIMKRIALDSLPTNRRHLLSALWDCGDRKAKALDYFTRKVSRIAKNTVRRELENLSELGAVQRVSAQVPITLGKRKSDGGPLTVKTTKTLYRLTDDFYDYCERVGGIPSP